MFFWSRAVFPSEILIWFQSFGRFESQNIFRKGFDSTGKPLIFGKKGSTLVFGCLEIQSHLWYRFMNLCARAYLECRGEKIIFAKGRCHLDHDITTYPQRTKIFRGFVFERDRQFRVSLTSHQGSGNIISLAKANCIFEVAEELRRLKKELVNNSVLTMKNKQSKGMVDISAKAPTQRTAQASAMLHFSKDAFKILLTKGSPKGDVFETAKVAGVMAAKSTPQIIPMCHPLELSKVSVQYKTDKRNLQF